MKSAIYTRVSTTEQHDSGYGLDAQFEKCSAMAIVKDAEIVAHLSDSVSGTKDQTEREGLARLLAMVSDGEIDCVIISSLDRLGRNTKLVLDLVEILEANNVDLVSCKESLDTSTPSGRFVLTMFAALGQLERDSIVERTTSGRNARGKIDGEKGGRVPYGYKRIITESEIIIDSEKASFVKEIFRLRQKENWTLTNIASHLNDNNVPTSRGGKWHASSVKIVLDNEEKYRGGQRGDSQDIHWPKIL